MFLSSVKMDLYLFAIIYKLSFIKLQLSCIAFLLAGCLHAQIAMDTTYVSHNRFGKISFIRFGLRTGLFPAAGEVPNIFLQFLNPSPEIDFHLTKSDHDNLDFLNNQYDIFYRGIKVEGMGYVVHIKDGRIISMGGNYRDIPEIDVAPAISMASGLQKALNVINAHEYIWQNQAYQNNLKQQTHNDSATYYPKGELMIADVSDDTTAIFTLCYMYEITALDPFTSENVFVNAKNGNVIKRVSRVRHTNDVQGSADTRYSGTQTIWTNTNDGSGYKLFEYNTSGRTIYTENLNRGDFNTNPVPFIDNDNSWTAAEWNNANKDNIALDIHWGSEKCFDYFKATFNRLGYNNNNNGAISNYVHYKSSYNDAVYVRFQTSDLAGVIACGDGDAQHGPYGSLDIYAHEYGHGFWDFTAGYPSNELLSKEIGAIDEGFADMWGSLIEAWVAPNKQTWISGEDIISGGLRNLSNPKSFNMPNTYHGQYWVNTDCGTPNENNDYCGIHTNMSVPDYAFYLLCEGGNGVNDLGNAYSVTGIGLDQAAQILYRTELVYMAYLPDLNVAFSGTRDAMVQAAIDLYGSNSCQVYAVMHAWYAVGVGPAYLGISVNGDNSFCTTSTYYTISGLPSGSSVLWQASPSGSATINSPNSLQTTLTRVSDGTITLFAIITDCGGQITVPKANIIVGNPFPQGTTYASSNNNYYNGPLLSSYSFFLPAGQWGLATFNITDPQYSSFSWSPVNVPSGSSWAVYGAQNQQLNLNIEAVGSAYHSNTITIQLNAQGPCGAYTNYFSATAVTSGGYGFSLAPNPAQDNVQVSASNTELKSTTASRIFAIKITDAVGSLRKRFDYSSGVNSVNISTADLAPGIYIVSVFEGQNWNTMKLLIQR
jgi:Zn-dependent metalloprotease